MSNLAEQIADDIGSFAHDPLAFTEYAYDWGKGDLEHHAGPRKWQAELLEIIGKELKRKKKSKNKVIRIAVASGHDIGKTALTSMIMTWAMSTHEDTRAQATANTGNQLKTKTWAELAKWHHRSINQDWFTCTATAFYSNEKGHELNWRADAAVWRENRTEAFAGLHNYGKRIVIIVDEASAVPQAIFDVIDSICFDENTEIIVIVFGNPTRNSGPFYDIFHKYKNTKYGDGSPMWITKQIDSRTVEGTNKAEMEAQIEKHGITSNWVKTRILGEFGTASAMQFIPNNIVQAARERDARVVASEPLIIGVDLARGGDDNCVFYFRCGRDGKSIPPVIIPGEQMHDSTRLVGKGIELFDQYKPDHIFGDNTGLGGPILDQWRKLGYNIHHVDFGGKSPVEKYDDMTAYMYSRAKDWMMAGGAIWDNPELEEQLCSREFDYLADGSTLFLESKKDMKKRGLLSPDIADALALTFAMQVGSLNTTLIGRKQEMKTTLTDYNPLRSRVNRARDRMRNTSH